MRPAWVGPESLPLPESLRVLVVEDEPDAATSLALLLKMEGHTARLAGEGAGALRIARQWQPDVVLLDLGLPGGMDGCELATHIQALPGDKKPLLVAVTGRDGRDDRRRSEAAGVDLHLVKPVNPVQLRDLLRRFHILLCG